MAVMHDAVQNGIGQGRFAEVGVPRINRQLAADDRGAGVESVVEDFQQVRSNLGRQGDQAPIVQDQDGCFGKSLEQFPIAPIAMRGSDFFEQPWHTPVSSRPALAA